VARDESPGIADIEQAMRDGSLRQSKTEAHRDPRKLAI
jgi:hypothetical protein